MNKKHNQLLDSSKIQQESLNKKRGVKRDEASGDIGENMNSEFHEEKKIKEMEKTMPDFYPVTRVLYKALQEKYPCE